MWTSTVGLVNGKHRYLTAEAFGFKVNSNGQQLKRRQQWTIEPFPENTGPDGSISSSASVSSQCPSQIQAIVNPLQQPLNTNDPCILTLGGPLVTASLNSVKSSSNGSASSDQDAYGEEHENVAIKSHLNKYLAVDSFGNVTCDSDEKTETARFTITICSMSQGRNKDEHIFWAFKNVERGYYLGTTDDGMICCNAKMPKSRAELWHLHLLPARGASFFAIKSLGRKRFARVTREDGVLKKSESVQVQLDANISWGAETLFQFEYHDGGRYTLLTSDNKLLTNEGKCIDWMARGDSGNISLPPPECLFTLEYHSGYLAFRDSFSQYLAAAGRSSVLRSRSVGVSRDELFVFESVPVQVSMKATFNNRWVSIKQGVDLSANQTETTSHYETFQLTFHKQTQNWSIMTHDCNFWTVSQNTNTVSVCRPGDYEGLTRGQFRLIWSDFDATFSLKYVNLNRQERWIAARKSGQLFLSNGNHEPVKFVMRFQNRRLLNLRPVDGNGFVGLRSGGSKQVEANKTMPDSMLVEYSELPTTPTHTSGALDQVSGQTANVNPSDNGSNEYKVINVFNVRLNNTKMGASVFERANISNQPATAKSKPQQTPEDYVVAADTRTLGQKEIDCGTDANNNCMESFENPDEASKSNGDCGVELTSAPSVASIINSFSNAKITNQPAVVNTEQKSHNQRVVGATVSRLASSYESSNGTNNQLGVLLDSDTVSVVTSCSSTSSSVSSSGATAIYSDCNNVLSGGGGSRNTLADQVAQSECCHLKLLSSCKYLVVGDGPDSNVLCDATNKACAQAWILELRSHNSIAIRASDNQAYMQLGTNGTIFLQRCEPSDASLWEF